MASVITSILSGGAMDGVSKIINSIRGRNPEDAAKIQELLQKHQDLVVQTEADLEKSRLQADVDLNKAAAGNIQTEEAQNWYTASARPSIIWVWVVLMLYNFGIAPAFKLGVAAFPDLFWEISGAAILGYVVSRTGEKVMSTTLGGAGGAVNLPFGFKLDSKGDKKQS